MNEATKIRLELAQRNAARYAANPNIKAILLTGSVVQGGADDYSDIDTSLYYEGGPTEAEFQAACEAARASGGDLHYGTAEEGFAVYEYIEGIRCDFGHGSMAQVEAMMQDFLETPDLEDMNKQIAISGFLDGVPLYGEDWIKAWQAKLAAYPPGLGPALVKKHLRFHPYWVLEKMGVARRDHLFLYETLVTAARNILGILCGLNQCYYPGKLKGMAWTISKMRLKPNNLLARLEQIFLADPAAAVAQLRELIEETLALVETHMPNVDTSRVRRILPMVLRK